MILSNLYTNICIEIRYPICKAIYCPIGWIYGIEIRNGCSVELCVLAQHEVTLTRWHPAGTTSKLVTNIKISVLNSFKCLRVGWRLSVTHPRRSVSKWPVTNLGFHILPQGPFLNSLFLHSNIFSGPVTEIMCSLVFAYKLTWPTTFTNEIVDDRLTKTVIGISADWRLWLLICAI